MMFLIVALAIILLAVLEKYWAPAAMKRLRFHGKCDRAWAAPGEPVTYSVTVENPSRLPIPFIRAEENFPVEARIQGDPRWLEQHLREGIYQQHVEERFSLKPRQSVCRSVEFTMPQRGVYNLGLCRLAVGDLLGFRELGRECSRQKLVVIPEPAKDPGMLDAFGGFLGDISVRRFILEDPILTVGFRDYTGREPMKAISWTRSAAAGTLQVKQYDHTAEQTIVVVLDVEGGRPEELEGCFRLARSVCEELERRKFPYGFRTNGNLPGPVGKFFFLPEGLGENHLNGILYGLGRADYTCYHSLSTLARQTVQKRKKNESYILITPGDSAETRKAVAMLEASGGHTCVLTGRKEARL